MTITRERYTEPRRTRTFYGQRHRLSEVFSCGCRIWRRGEEAAVTYCDPHWTTGLMVGRIIADAIVGEGQ